MLDLEFGYFDFQVSVLVAEVAFEMFEIDCLSSLSESPALLPFHVCDCSICHFAGCQQCEQL